MKKINNLLFLAFLALSGPTRKASMDQVAERGCQAQPNVIVDPSRGHFLLCFFREIIPIS